MTAGAATAATLNAPQDVLWTGGSDFLIADTGNFNVRAVTSGTINRVVGTGAACTATALCGDGGLASLAGLGGPYALSTDRAGGYLIADSGGNRIRQVTAAGIITTLAGTGVVVHNDPALRRWRPERARQPRYPARRLRQRRRRALHRRHRQPDQGADR